MAALDEFSRRTTTEARCGVPSRARGVLTNVVGRPTPVTEAKRFAELCRRIQGSFLSARPEPTGAHKITMPAAGRP